jgi:hypothetical protein
MPDLSVFDSAGVARTIKALEVGGKLIEVTTKAAASTSATTAVPVNVAAVDLLAANADRLPGTKGINTSTTRTLTLSYGTGTPSDTHFYTKLVPGEEWEMPDLFSGVIRGIWDGADAAGYFVVTELTP